MNRADLSLLDGLQNQNITPKANDTIIIKVKSPQVILQHIFNVCGSINLLFHKGDTLLISYNKETPNFKVLNRKYRALDLDLDKYIRNRYAIKGYLPTEYYSTPFLELDFKKANITDQLIKIKEKYRTKSFSYFTGASALLDSLLREKLISDDVYQFNKENFFYFTLILNLENNKVPYKEACLILKNNQQSEITRYSYYTNFLYTFSSHFFETETKKISVGNGFIYDYTKVFNRVDTFTYINKPYKQLLLTSTLDQIHEYFPASVFNIYYDRLKKIVTDPESLNTLSLKYRISDPSEKNPNSFQLIDVNHKSTSLEKIKASLKGKLIYVDFWASWCGPCISVLPKSKKLIKALSEEKCVYLFISLDKDFESWKRFLVDQGMNNYKYNFMISDQDKSGFIKDMGINLIPKYLLFDQNGKLLSKNFAGPEAKNIYNLLMQQIK
jgi:thiol-disulfide isomerase/thioredoxin